MSAAIPCKARSWNCAPHEQPYGSTQNHLQTAAALRVSPTTAFSLFALRSQGTRLRQTTPWHAATMQSLKDAAHRLCAGCWSGAVLRVRCERIENEDAALLAPIALTPCSQILAQALRRARLSHGRAARQRSEHRLSAGGVRVGARILTGRILVLDTPRHPCTLGNTGGHATSARRSAKERQRN
jgi:hypothetical protein